MKNKKGLWFGEEAGKIVLGVIGIVLMIFLMFKLIGILIQKTEYEQAKVAMREIEDTINSLKEGEVGYAFIESPKGWWILAWPYQNFEQKPQTCGENCVCICPTPTIATKKNSLRECESKGICKKTSKKVITINNNPPEGIINTIIESINIIKEGYTNNLPIYIESPTELEITVKEKEVVIKNRVEKEWTIDKFIDSFLLEAESGSKLDSALNELHIAILKNVGDIKNELSELEKTINNENKKNEIQQIRNELSELEKESVEINKLFIEYKTNYESQKISFFSKYILRLKGSEISDEEYKKLKEKRTPIIKKIVEIRKKLEDIKNEI
ncbi:MAG: hypothetical protein QXX68_01980 [Candidatus Pacearchaeota archaeon]